MCEYDEDFGSYRPIKRRKLESKSPMMDDQWETPQNALPQSRPKPHPRIPFLFSTDEQNQELVYGKLLEVAFPDDPAWTQLPELKQYIAQTPPRATKEDVQGLDTTQGWWVSEYTNEPQFWWLVTGEGSFFIDKRSNVFTVSDSSVFDFYSEDGSDSLFTGNLVGNGDLKNGRKFEFLVEDVLKLKGQSCLRYTLERRLQNVGNQVVLPFRKHHHKEKRHFPFEVRGKFIVHHNHLKQIVSCIRFSESSEMYIYKDKKERENFTQGYVFVHDNFKPFETGSRKRFHWSFPPSVLVRIRQPWVDSRGQNTILLVNSDDNTEVEAWKHKLSEKSAQKLREYGNSYRQASTVIVSVRYDKERSMFEILKCHEPSEKSRPDTLERFLDVLETQIGSVGFREVKMVCFKNPGKSRQRRTQRQPHPSKIS